MFAALNHCAGPYLPPVAQHVKGNTVRFSTKTVVLIMCFHIVTKASHLFIFPSSPPVWRKKGEKNVTLQRLKEARRRISQLRPTQSMSLLCNGLIRFVLSKKDWPLWGAGISFQLPSDKVVERGGLALTITLGFVFSSPLSPCPITALPSHSIPHPSPFLPFCLLPPPLPTLSFLSVSMSLSPTEICAADCGGHGVCVSGSCRCDDGWMGTGCDQRACHPRCNEHGTCKDGKCECSPGWNGEHCTIGRHYWEEVSVFCVCARDSRRVCLCVGKWFRKGAVGGWVGARR